MDDLRSRKRPAELVCPADADGPDERESKGGSGSTLPWLLLALVLLGLAARHMTTQRMVHAKFELEDAPIILPQSDDLSRYMARVREEKEPAYTGRGPHAPAKPVRVVDDQPTTATEEEEENQYYDEYEEEDLPPPTLQVIANGMTAGARGVEDRVLKHWNKSQHDSKYARKYRDATWCGTSARRH